MMLTLPSREENVLSSPSACSLYRSPVPDLLFEDVQEARLEEVAPYLECAEAISARAPLHRVTVFLTYRCNLDCPYCKTIARNAEELRLFPQKAATFTYEAFAAFLDSLAPTPIRHLHFTGGEAALLKDLPRMVALARQRGIAYLSITSNGTLPFACYQALVESGIDEIRISIDARDAEIGESLTGRKYAWRRAADNLAALAALKAEYPSFFLLANTVITRTNRVETVEIVRFLLSLGVDDMKLITVVQEKEDLGDFPEADAVREEIARLLADYPAEAFPLLRRKIATVFAPEAIGLETTRQEPPKDWRCYIPLTERTVDGVYYYPCSVYLREGGAPLGRITEPAELQRKKTAQFVRHGDCLNDSICRQYCLHCTRNYNIAANDRRTERGEDDATPCTDLK